MVSIFTQIVRGVVNFFCGPSAPEQPPQGPGQGHPHPAEPQTHPPPAHEHTPSYPSRPSHRPQQHSVDQKQLNKHNEHYVSLRAQANAEGDLMSQSFESSHAAYSRGDGALAKELANKGKAHQRKMESLNKEASDWIFSENNKDSMPGEIDLHGLYVKEAIAHTDQAIQQAKRRGDSQVRLIVGKGLHSPGGAAKVRPAIEGLIQNNRLAAEIDPDNAGVLIVHMDGGGHGDQIVGADEITRRLQQKEGEGCVIM